MSIGFTAQAARGRARASRAASAPARRRTGGDERNPMIFRNLPLGHGGRRRRREAERLTPKKFKTRLDARFAMIHSPPRLQQAKGGDPMSHGSAVRSVLLVREIKA